MREIIIYTKSTCPYCTKAKALLARRNLSLSEIVIEGRDDLRTEMIQRSNGRTTVPQVFINGEHIGGCDDLHAYEAKGGLE
jgi:glutaredoxin 3